MLPFFISNPWTVSYLTYSCPQEANSSWEPNRRYFKHSLSPLMVMASTDTTSAQKRCKNTEIQSKLVVLNLTQYQPWDGSFRQKPIITSALLNNHIYMTQEGQKLVLVEEMDHRFIYAEHQCLLCSLQEPCHHRSLWACHSVGAGIWGAWVQRSWKLSRSESACAVLPVQDGTKLCPFPASKQC